MAREEGGITGTYDGGNLHIRGADPQARVTEPLEDDGCGFIKCEYRDPVGSKNPNTSLF
jgi:hypothetical protein